MTMATSAGTNAANKRSDESMPRTSVHADRLDKETAETACRVVVEQLLATPAFTFEAKASNAVPLADVDTLNAARGLWGYVVNQLVCDRVMREAEERNLFPITPRALSSLLCEAVPLYKPK
jgi:hypothetical protein